MSKIDGPPEIFILSHRKVGDLVGLAVGDFVGSEATECQNSKIILFQKTHYTPIHRLQVPSCKYLWDQDNFDNDNARIFVMLS